MIPLIFIGIVMIPAGVAIIAMGMGEDAVFPTGLYTGPILIVLGIILAIMGVHGLAKPPE